MKRFSLLALPLILAACTNVTLPGQGSVGMTPTLTGAGINIVMTVKRDTSGNVTGVTLTHTTAQPQLTFSVAPGSLGITVTGYQVTVLDSSGNVYAGVYGQYQRSTSLRVMGGWGCANAAGTSIDYNTDQCAYTNKVQYARTVTTSSYPLLEANVPITAADEYYNTAPQCPSLKMNVVFTGYDDLLRTITPLAINNVPLTVTCSTVAG